MKSLFLVLASLVLVSCTASAIKGEWHNEDDQSRTLIRFSGNYNCFIFVGGPVDGMASECKYRKLDAQSFELWFVDEAGNTEEGYFLPFTYNHESGVILVNTEGRIIELRKK